MGEARQQSVYDEANLIYLRNQALSCGRRPDSPAHKTEIMAFTTDVINLNLFAHYAASKDTTLQAHQYPVAHQYLVDSTNLTGSHQGHKDGTRGPEMGRTTRGNSRTP